MTFIPSSYQEAIFSFIQSGTGHAVIDAVAGSGKTTSLIEAAKLLPRECNALFVAFNKHIATPLGERLKANGIYNMEASTIHSLGNRMLGKTQIDSNKYRDLCKQYLMNAISPYLFSAKLVTQMKDIVNFVQLTMTATTEEEIIKMVKHYGIDVDLYDAETWPVLWRGIAPVIEAGKKMYQNARIIDFNDMVCLPTVLGLALPRYDFIFTDECQDLNKAQLELIMRVRKPNGRMIFVGDKRQSLYGFTGADTESIDNIIKRTQATVLPLSICYRCPSSHVKLAAQVWEGIESSPTAEEGTVEEIKGDELFNQVKVGDLVICRTTAPLVSECLALLRSGIPATVRGRDIGKTLTEVIEKVKKHPNFSLLALPEIITDYRRQQISILSAKPDNEMMIESLEDKIDTVIALIEAYMSKQAEANTQGSIEGLKAYIESFFSDDMKAVVMFSTVHKAKGLEYDRVFILRPDLFPHPAAKQEWQIEQEYNIEYVALTRAKKALYFVDGIPGNLSLGNKEEPATTSAKKRGRPVGAKTAPEKLTNKTTLLQVALPEAYRNALVELLGGTRGASEEIIRLMDNDPILAPLVAKYRNLED